MTGAGSGVGGRVSLADADATVATIDHDGTIIESHTRDAYVAYEETRGYQPLVAVWHEQDLIVADEFREGNVAGGEDRLSAGDRLRDRRGDGEDRTGRAP
jgi:hypothetical protein